MNYGLQREFRLMGDLSMLQSMSSKIIYKIFRPLLVVALLIATAMTWLSWKKFSDQKTQVRFNNQTSDIIHNIQNRLNEYQLIAWGATGLFIASNDVTREEWRAYINHLRINEHFPEILGVGYSEVIYPSELTSHIQKVRDEGYPNYTVWPEGQRDFFSPVIFIEPFSAQNQRVFGFDVFSEPVRRAAMESARDTALPVLTSKVRLYQEAEGNNQPGFILYVPLYDNNAPHLSVQERRKSVRGFISIPFRISDFIHEINLTTHVQEEIHFTIYDGASVNKAALLFESDDELSLINHTSHPILTTQKTIDLSGHQWTLAFSSTPYFEQGSDFFISTGILVFGFCFTFLFYILAGNREKNFHLASIMAKGMTSELEAAKKQADDLAQKFELILNSAGEGIYGLDPTGHIIFVNPSATRMLGFSTHELLGHHVCLFTHHNHVVESCDENKECPINLTLQDGQPRQTAEAVFWNKNDIPFPVKYTIMPMRDDSGQFTGAVITFNDISEHLHAEKEHFERQMADQANKAKNNFLAQMSHEIRTPMNAVLGCTQILLADQTFSTRQTELLQTIERAGGHLLALINDILDISKIEAGQIQLNESLCNLHDLVGDMKAVFYAAATDKGIRFFIDHDDTIPRHVIIDGAKLRQVLMKLLENAIKYTEHGGVVLRIRADGSKKKGEKEHSHVSFEVEDTGNGIPDEELERIFTPFEHVATGTKSGGTGLGLPISSKLVQILGGQLQVESTPGHGSRFFFQIPLQEVLNITEQKEVDNRSVIGLDGVDSLRILVVDDSDSNRDLLRKFLEIQGFEIFEACNGQEALDSFFVIKPHAVLMDIQMPIMDGLEATRRLRTTDQGATVPIIAISGNTFEDDQKQGLAIGMTAYLTKPFRSEKLYKVLSDCLNLQPLYQRNDEYQPTTQVPITTEILASLSSELTDGLRKAVQDGDIALLRQLIDQIGQHDATIASGLRTLADRYDYQQLERILQGGKQNHG